MANYFTWKLREFYFKKGSQDQDQEHPECSNDVF